MYQNEVWVAGGFNGHNDLDIVEIYIPETDTWRTGPSMVRPRFSLTMEIINGTLMTFGDHELYGASREKLVGGEWVEEPMQYEHSYHASVSRPCP